MAGKYLVSICIPTRNRAEHLKNCLDSLVCQPEFLEGKVEIVVSDNASTDDTADVVKIYLGQYKNIVYNRNPHNMGHINGDYNFGIAMLLGHGLLRKLSNDYLIYQSGSLKFFCDAAEKYGNEQPILYFSNGVGNRLVDDETRMSDPGQFLITTNNTVTWIATFSLWEKDCQNLERAFKNSKTGLWHLEKLGELLGKGRSVIYFSYKFAENTGGSLKSKDISYGFWNVLHNNYFSILNQFVEAGWLDANVVKCIDRDMLFYIFKDWLVAKELNIGPYKWDENENLKKEIFDHYSAESYFKKFLISYNLLLWKRTVKQFLKNIPILGDFLIQFRHCINNTGNKNFRRK